MEANNKKEYAIEVTATVKAMIWVEAESEAEAQGLAMETYFKEGEDSGTVSGWRDPSKPFEADWVDLPESREAYWEFLDCVIDEVTAVQEIEEAVAE